MRTTEYSSQFKKDYKREKRSGQHTGLSELFAQVVQALADDEPLAERYRDHELTGNWGDHRECHLKPDLLLIYRKPDEAVLQLVRLGSHNELFN